MRISDWSSDVCSSDLFPCAPPSARENGAGECTPRRRTIFKLRQWIHDLPVRKDAFREKVKLAPSAPDRHDLAVFGDMDAAFGLVLTSPATGAIGITFAGAGFAANRGIAFAHQRVPGQRSEERRGGKECGRPCRYGGAPSHK